MPETQEFDGRKLNDLRQRVVNGEEVSDDELREAISYIHQFRGKDVAQSKSSKKKVTQEEAQAALDGLLGG